MSPPGAITDVEELLHGAVSWLRLGVEAVGAIIIVLGVIAAVIKLMRMLGSRARNFNPVRLTLAAYLALALEFQLGADLLGTAVSPSWDQLGKLAVVAVIRTGLNYFLMQEMKSERETAKGNSALNPG